MAFLTIATTSLAFTEIFTCSRMGTCSKVTDKKMNRVLCNRESKPKDQFQSNDNNKNKLERKGEKNIEEVKIILGMC